LRLLRQRLVRLADALACFKYLVALLANSSPRVIPLLLSSDSESSFFASSSANSCFFEPEESRYFCANANDFSVASL
jgi:hypothetical protein